MFIHLIYLIVDLPEDPRNDARLKDTPLNVLKTFRCTLSRSLLIEQDQRHFHCCVQFYFKTYGTW